MKTEGLSRSLVHLLQLELQYKLQMGKTRLLGSQQRLLKNRQSAKASRLRSKAKIKALEGEIAQLSAESAQLLSTAAALHPPEVEEAQNSLVQQLASLMVQEAGEAEIAEVMQEMGERLGMQGSVRLEALKKAFKRTIWSLVPEPLLTCLVLSEAFEPPMLPLMEMSLSPHQFEAFRHWNSILTPQCLALKEALSGFKAVASDILRQANSLHLVVARAIKPLLSRVQLAHFVLWLSKQYGGLEAEKVLNYGHSTAEVLS